MRSSSVFGRNGFVLTAILPMIILILFFISVYSLDIYRLSVQQRLLRSMDRFSLVEMTVVNQTIKQFLTHDPQNFDLDLEEYRVSVIFDGETAHITYDNDLELEAILSFDMVFGYVIDYRLDRNGDSD